MKYEKFEDTKWVIRCGNWKDRQYNGQNKRGKRTEKQGSTKHYTEN